MLGSARERGVSLVVVLLFLVATTGISVWMARQSMLAEGMARNQMDQEIARQAAESALRDAERDINTASTGGTASDAPCARGEGEWNFMGQECEKGLCFTDDAHSAQINWTTATAANRTTAEPWWPKSKGGLWNNDDGAKPGRVPGDPLCSTFKGGVPLGTYTGVPPIRGVAKQPEYLLERFRRKRMRRSDASDNNEGSGAWVYMYRITARGFGYSRRTQVVLQTVFLHDSHE
ncbi:pilus assembly PilX family protein [Verminephrobacter aporrectodeae]|nr:PilX N-terminal domain-containing pilus assembly protein [Verminephrobacter aporrectodeae]